MQNPIVSYALFGHPAGGSWKTDGTPGRIDGYLRYLPAIIRAHHLLWRGWELVLHVDHHVWMHRYYGALEKMHQRGLLRLVKMGRADPMGVGWAPMWRFAPAFETGANLVLCHDIDSYPSITMRRCAEHFVHSTAIAAVVHGCESHNTAMAGLFLLRAPAFREALGVSSWSDFITMRTQDWGPYGSDEHYLRDVVWPRLWERAMLIRIGNRNSSLINAPDVIYDVGSSVPPGVVAVPETWIASGGAPYPGAAGFDAVRVVEEADNLDLLEIRAIQECENGIATGLEIARL